MELIDIIYEGLQISIALLGVVIILSYLISRLRLKNKKINKEQNVNLNINNSLPIIPQPLSKNNFYYNEAIKYRGTNKIYLTNPNLIYLKSSNDILKESVKSFNNEKNNGGRTRYTIINEEMRKKSNNSVINFM
ncbi:MAG: hypothetical protein WHS65_04460 [Melioribacteraceae bacterium]